jgi:hypothetical protein
LKKSRSKVDSRVTRPERGTRDAVETAIDQSKRDKSGAWEDLLRTSRKVTWPAPTTNGGKR